MRWGPKEPCLSCTGLLEADDRDAFRISESRSNSRQFETQLQATLNIIPAYTWYAAPSGALTFLNERYADYLGLPADHPLRFGIPTDAAWDSHIALLHPDDKEESRRVWSTCLSSGCAGETSFRVRDAEGSYRWFLSRAEPLRGQDGTLLYWIGINLDMEERKQAEFYLAEGQRLGHIGSWAFGPGGFDYWSSELLQIHGLDTSSKPPTVDEYLALVHPEDRESVMQEVQKMLATNCGRDFTKRIVRPDGSLRRVRCVRALATQTGVLRRFVGTGVDVTEQDQLTEELGRNEFYLAEAERLAHMGSWVFDPAGFFTYWSRELFHIYALDPAAEGVRFDEYLARVHPQDREFMRSLIQRMIEEGSGCDVTKRIVRPNGEIRYIRCVGAPVVEDGKLKQIVGTAMDVTEHQLLTQELERRELYLAEAQRLSHTGSFGWNISTDEHFWSDETFRIFELDPAGKISLPMILDRVHPQDRTSVEMAIASATNGVGIDLEYRLLMPDGRIKYLHVVGKAERDNAGRIEVIGAVMDVTERKRTEVELRRSKAHLTDAQRLSRTGTVGMEASTKRIFWSDEAARIYGYAPGTEPTPDLILQRVHPDDVDLLKSVLERAGQGGSDFDFEHRLLMPDGSIKHIHNLTHCSRDEAGNEEVVGAIIDITERKVAEDAIRRSEGFLAEAQRLSHTGSFGFKTNNGEIVWSDETYRIFEYDRAEKPTFDMVMQRIDPQDRLLAQRVIERVSKTGEDFEHECRLLMPNGATKHIHVRSHALHHSTGAIEFVGAVSDITGRKDAEQRLKQQEMGVSQMLDFTPLLVAVFGPNRERLFANRVALDYLGKSLDEWQQGPFADSIHPEDLKRYRAESDRSLKTGAPYELELRLRKRDGSYRWFLARFHPVRDDKGQIIRWYVACTDIDERKGTEEKLQRENANLREEIDQKAMFEEIVGNSPALQAVLTRISKVAPSDSTVLIMGETGTGKELIARSIHRRSNRGTAPFISVNCAAVPRELILSELFGHERGAFTGATQRRLGRFELADGGTIFLDEIGELVPDTQVALLRVLQEREFERVGGRQSLHVNVRVIAATNRDLKKAVANGTFRQDLFYRLNVFPIALPPLRERKGDILMLVEYFIQRYATKAGKTIRSIDKRALDLLQTYDWPGNIRELQNVIERSVILTFGDVLSVDELWLSHETSRPNSVAEASATVTVTEPRTEREIIETVLAETRGRVSGPSGAAAKLRIPPSTLADRIKALKINRSKFKFPG